MLFLCAVTTFLLLPEGNKLIAELVKLNFAAVILLIYKINHSPAVVDSTVTAYGFVVIEW